MSLILDNWGTVITHSQQGTYMVLVRNGGGGNLQAQNLQAIWKLCSHASKPIRHIDLTE